MANPNNVAGGHKANLNNPNTSDEAKQNSKEALDSGVGSEEHTGGEEQVGGLEQDDKSLKNENNVIGGHKATLNNPRVGEEAKEHSEQVLKEHGVDV